jgi:23S rRNA pseudouridine1911/1915/1917 synthase
VTARPLLARLRAEFPDSSVRRLKEWLAGGRVRVNGVVVGDPRAATADADTVTLGPPAPPPFPAPLRLVHEDEALLVIEKPSGLLTIATERQRERTAYHLVHEYLAARRPPGRPFIVHRLDRDTSGLLVVAKTPAAKRHLQAQFAHRTARRTYTAVVEGQVRDDAGLLASRLSEDRGLRVRSRPTGRPAVTRYRVLDRQPDATLLELALGTGRRHQIRVQLAELGHPIVGDVAHGSRRDPVRRLCLHASGLGFVHPDTGQPLAFQSPPPEGFRRALGVHWERGRESSMRRTRGEANRRR